MLTPLLFNIYIQNLLLEALKKLKEDVTKMGNDYVRADNDSR